MTREEAIRIFENNKRILSIPNCEAQRQIEAIDMAISALSVIDQTKWERDTALATLEEHGIGLGQNAEPNCITELPKEAVETDDEVIESKADHTRIDHDREWVIGCIKHDGFIHTYRFDKANQIILDALEQTEPSDKGGGAEMNETKSPFMQEIPSEDGSDLISRADVLSLFPNAFYDGLASQIKALPSVSAEREYMNEAIKNCYDCEANEVCKMQPQQECIFNIPFRGVGEWIPCSERLPQNDEEVLITYEWRGVTGTIYREVTIDWYSKDEWHEVNSNHYGLIGVLAWQPLPKPYEAKMENKK